MAATMSINEMKQYSKNVLYTKEAMKDLHDRAEKAGYSLFSVNRPCNFTFYLGGYWEFQEEIWTNGVNCVRLHYVSWNWGKDHPDFYEFDGHVLTDDEKWGRVPVYRPSNGK